MMIVQELIEKLKEYPLDMQVCILIDEHDDQVVSPEIYVEVEKKNVWSSAWKMENKINDEFVFIH